MAGVVVLTDSTASLIPDQASRAGIEIIALQVVLDGVTSAEGTTGATGAEVAAALRAGQAVTTSRPTPEAFANGYRKVAERGASAAVSVHLSRQISGTYDAAVLAARSAPIPVTVIDSRTLAMAMGFPALDGARVAAAGAGADEVGALIRRQAEASVAYFSVNSLEYLRRGGRIGVAQALLGSALAVKPLLTVTEGVIRPYERVRTRAKAIARLADLAFEAGAAALERGRSLRMAVHHLDDAAGASHLEQRIRTRLSDLGVPQSEVVVSEISAVVGAHVGPGALGVVVAPELSS